MSVHVRLILSDTGDPVADGQTAWEGHLPEVPAFGDLLGLGLDDDGGEGPYVQVLDRPNGWQLSPPRDGGMVAPTPDVTVTVLITVMPVPGERWPGAA